MRDFVLPEGINDNHAHGRWLFNSFVSLLHHPNADCFFGIAHTLWACGKSNDDKNEILSAITDEEFIYCGELAAKKGITVLNAPGTIDADYRGEVCVILVNLSDTDFVVEKGERIAQLVLARHEVIEWQETSELASSDRGEGGFGSTGIK